MADLKPDALNALLSASSHPHRGKKLSNLELEPMAFAGQRLRRGEQL
jgi:hypothetical protein